MNFTIPVSADVRASRTQRIGSHMNVFIPVDFYVTLCRTWLQCSQKNMKSPAALGYSREPRDPSGESHLGCVRARYV